MVNIFVSLCCIFMFTYSLACDVCGSAVSSFSMGLLPNSKHHFFGIRNNIKFFESNDLHETSNRPTNELFSSTDLLFRYKLNQRFQFIGLIPYIYNVRKDNEFIQKIKGLGDVSFLGNFVFVETTDSLSKKVKQSGTFGLGVKVPTGKSFILGLNELNMLPGTGSWDYFVNLNYSIQHKSFGLQSETSYTYKTENKYLYRFGNSIGSNLFLFYRWNVNQSTKFIPQVGFTYSYNWKDKKNSKITEDTYNGGDLLNYSINLQVMYKKMGVSAQIFIPIKQQLNEGYVKQKQALRFSINYFITAKK